MKDELVDSTYLRLKACAISVEQYFTWDIREDILEKDDISYQFIDSLQDEHIEQTLFMEDERFITSIVDKDGNRAEGTKADPQIWETVRAGNDYETDGVEIQGEEYEPWFTPVLETALDRELPGEIESLIFCIQTGIGVGIIAFIMGRFVERKKWTDSLGDNAFEVLREKQKS